jgi:hypothetical protein
MVLDCGAIIARGIKSVCLCAQAKRQSLLAAQAFRDKQSCLSQAKRFLSAYSDFLDDEFREPLDKLLTDQYLVFRKKFAAGGLAG